MGESKQVVDPEHEHAKHRFADNGNPNFPEDNTIMNSGNPDCPCNDDNDNDNNNVENDNNVDNNNDNADNDEQGFEELDGDNNNNNNNANNRTDDVQNTVGGSSL